MGTSFSGSFKFFTGFTHPTNANASAAANAVANTVVNGNSLAWSGSAIQGVADIGGSYLAVANLIQRSSPPVATHTDGYVVLYKLDENGVASSLLGLLGCGDEESCAITKQINPRALTLKQEKFEVLVGSNSDKFDQETYPSSGRR